MNPMAHSIIDAYMHVGLPRFGSAAEALQTMDRWGTAKAVLVLGPGVPDVAALAEAQRARPDAIRTMGIPYGDTPEKRLICAEACFAAGAIGFRLQRDETVDNPDLMRRLGARGGWAFATDPLFSVRHTEFLLQWLDDHPKARVGAPHFLSPDLARLEGEPARRLLEHERFHPIFSRQGQCGSREPRPHRDLKPWVERVVAQCGWRRCLWGSEYPVLFWRGEQIDESRRWVRDLGVEISEDDYVAFTCGNAQRLFFSQPAPKAAMPELPDWIKNFPTPMPVGLSPHAPVPLPMDVYAPLMAAYLQRNRPDARLTFAEFCVEQLRQGLAQPSH